MTDEEGLDVVVGDNRMGERIAQEITAALGGRYTIHPKLTGEKDGKRLFRITYSIRLPRLQKGDVVEVGGEYLELRETGKRQLKVFHLGTGSMTTLPPLSTYRVVGNVRDGVPALIAYMEGKTAGIIDPVTFVTREVRMPGWVKAATGSQVRVITDKQADRIIVVG
jgi:nonsense-mediated mRNA decay protein 3